MGRQINFFMDCPDEIKFINFLKNDLKLILYIDCQRNSIPQEMEKLLEYGTPYFFSIVLWSNNFKSPIWKKIEKREEYSFEKMKSEVFEFLRSTVRENKVKRGRIWYETSYYENHQLIKKPEYMDKVYDQIVRWIKKNSKRIGSDYYFPSAIELKDKGYIFTQ